MQYNWNLERWSWNLEPQFNNKVFCSIRLLVLKAKTNVDVGRILSLFSLTAIVVQCQVLRKKGI